MAVSTAAILVAAGSGTRLGASVRKAFVPLAGRPLFEHALDVLRRAPSVGEVVLVLHAADVEAVERRFAREADAEAACPVRCVSGGAERWHSVRRGVEAATPSRSIVAIHDAARPLVSVELVERVIAAAREHGAAIPAVPVVDTLKRVDGGFGGDTVARESLVRVQTPQAFDRERLLAAMRAWRTEAWGHPTDESQVVERAGLRVRIVEGDERNLKVTTPEDLEVAEAWWTKRTTR